MTFFLKHLFVIKTIVIIVLFVLLSFNSFSQKKGSYEIVGQIIDSLNNDPIEYASVAIYRIKDTLLINGSMTNFKGEFSIKGLNAGKYIVKSNFIGYKPKSTIVEISNTSVHLAEPIVLGVSSIFLNEVQITGSKIEKQVTIEKTNIDVSQNISAVSGSITDVLKSQSPISIDAENNVYLRGNSNILILLDGRPTTVPSLVALPSSNVDNIEIITNPDAKYDAEGTGGIINIVTKKQSVSGLNGTLTLNYGINNRLNGGVGLNYSKKIWAIGFNYNGRSEKSDVKSFLSRDLYSQNTHTEQDVNSSLSNPTHSFGLSLSAKPNNKNLISLNLKSVIYDNLNTQNIAGNQINSDLSQTFFNRTNEVTWKRRNIDGTLSYKKIFEKNKHEISFDAMYSLTKGARTGDYRIEGVYLQKSDAGGRPQNITFQTDYLKQIFRTGRIETGLKAFSRWNSFYSHFFDKDIATDRWLINSTYSNDLEYKEYIYSTYLMYSDSLTKKIFYKIGARVEYNTAELIQKSTQQNINAEYFFPFPFLLIKYSINQAQSLSVSLTRRVTRPAYPQINPYIVVIDQITYETGNKQLKPEIVDKLELNHSLMKDKFQLRSNLFYGITNDFITQISVLTADKLMVTYANGNKQIKTGVDVDATYKFNPVFSINPAFSLFYSKSNGAYNNTDLSTSGAAWTGNLKFTVKPDKRTDIQLLFNYNSPIDLPQFRLNEIYYADFAVKRNFLKNKVALSFTVTDVFNTRQWIINTENSAYKLYNKSKNDTRIFWFGLTFNINSYKPTNGKSNELESENSVIKLGQ